jgi:diaminopropionate ammonia-lyase
MEIDGTPGEVFIKDERGRMGLGSFKALGAAYVIAHMAEAGPLKDEVFVTASAGNHGLSVARGAEIFGAKAVIYLSRVVPENFAERLRRTGAEVRREGDSYEDSMEAALKAAEEGGWTLLSDTSWPGYTEMPHRLMEGYLVLAAEAVEQMGEQMGGPASHIFLQAAVGGLAGACAAYFRAVWGDAPQIYVVEPEAAPALHDAVAAGKFVKTSGPPSSMGRLDCKEASLIGLNGLSRDADGFILMSDEEVEAAMPRLDALGLETTPSGGAGLVAAMSGKVDLPEDARILVILSEEA